jgi:signal peptidase I
MISATRPLSNRVPAWLTRIESDSMRPTLRPGQLALTTRLRRTSTVRRGSLVVVDSRELRRRIVKRVIGLPGDQIRIHDGLVYINDALYREPYVTRSVFNGLFQVPAERYFLLGDNRDASSDSRSWAMPYVTRDQIRGKLHPLLATRPRRPGNSKSTEGRPEWLGA